MSKTVKPARIRVPSYAMDADIYLEHGTIDSGIETTGASLVPVLAGPIVHSDTYRSYRMLTTRTANGGYHHFLGGTGWIVKRKDGEEGDMEILTLSHAVPGNWYLMTVIYGGFANNLRHRSVRTTGSPNFDDPRHLRLPADTIAVHIRGGENLSLYTKACTAVRIWEETYLPTRKLTDNTPAGKLHKYWPLVPCQANCIV